MTAALAAHLLGLRRSIKVVAWILVALTVGATIHLGWHYVVDDFGGVAIAVLASLAIARLLITASTCAPLRERPVTTRGRDMARRLGAAGSSPSRPSSRACSPRDSVGLPLRDPDHVAALYLALVGLGVAVPRRARRRPARPRTLPAAAGRHARRWPRCGASAGRGPG